MFDHSLQVVHGLSFKSTSTHINPIDQRVSQYNRPNRKGGLSEFPKIWHIYHDQVCVHGLQKCSNNKLRSKQETNLREKCCCFLFNKTIKNTFQMINRLQIASFSIFLYLTSIASNIKIIIWLVIYYMPGAILNALHMWSHTLNAHLLWIKTSSSCSKLTRL